MYCEINTARPFSRNNCACKMLLFYRGIIYKALTCSDLNNSRNKEASLPSILCMKFPLIISFTFPLIKFHLVPPNQALNKNSNKQFKTQHPDAWMVWKQDINGFRVFCLFFFSLLQGQSQHPAQENRYEVLLSPFVLTNTDHYNHYDHPLEHYSWLASKSLWHMLDANWILMGEPTSLDKKCQ